MRNWIGPALFLAGSLLIWAGWLRKQRVLAARTALAARGIFPEPPALTSMATYGEILRPMILWFMAYVGLKTAFLFWVMAGTRWFSWLDLGGLLFLFAGYGTWMSLRVTYRFSDLEAAEKAARAGQEAQAPAEPETEPVGERAGEASVQPRRPAAAVPNPRAVPRGVPARRSFEPPRTAVSAGSTGSAGRVASRAGRAV
ncbi:hypothetical protein A33M_3064 [Rhodovulum sp. PH10]|uniref:hypothetical protein n=1 Tax=Rhodovulum sp. PH10 TaxID=1187851 RepID=UPI00027C1E3F|nr:hypothetical protein [Rhodovulum sp. PH10]EJW11534.1 hypothetical protein A33M_3064 [Rhodovulum sp. PH10]